MKVTFAKKRCRASASAGGRGEVSSQLSGIRGCPLDGAGRRESAGRGLGALISRAGAGLEDTAEDKRIAFRADKEGGPVTAAAIGKIRGALHHQQRRATFHIQGI